MISLFVSMWLLFHPVHVSVTSVEYQQDQDGFEVIAKFFLDDFQLMYHEFYQMEIFKLENNERADAYEMFLNEDLIIQVNGEKLEASFVQERSDEESVWITFFYPLEESPQQLVVTNKLMMNLYHDQQNLLIYKDEEMEKGVQFMGSRVRMRIK